MEIQGLTAHLPVGAAKLCQRRIGVPVCLFGVARRPTVMCLYMPTVHAHSVVCFIHHAAVCLVVCTVVVDGIGIPTVACCWLCGGV